MPGMQSWTDPFTNYVDLAALEVGNNLEELVGAGTMPPDTLLSLLHEGTHHWCFLSPVGSVIAALRSRVRRNALAAAKHTTDDYDSFLLDLVACRVATELLRPLGEGLAVAAEQDSLTRKTEYISAPFLAVARAFAVPEDTDPVIGYLPLAKALITARKGPAGLRRKLNVYADPIGPDGRGYLQGYLAVRTLMRTLAAKDSRLLEETDLAISYLRSFFYDDWGLVEILLSRGSNIDSLGLANAISGHLNDRFTEVSSVTE